MILSTPSPSSSDPGGTSCGRRIYSELCSKEKQIFEKAMSSLLLIILVIIAIHFSSGQKPTFQYSDGKYWGQYYVDEFGDKIPHGRGIKISILMHLR